MTGRGEGHARAAGGPARHVPVLLEEVVECLAPARGGTVVDGTFGAGGYSRAILAADDRTRVIAIDRDPAAIAAGQALHHEAKGRLTLLPGRFGELDRLLVGRPPVDAVVLDVGVSSMQLDDGGRGFSFRHDGPLDMRMGLAEASAADLVNDAPEAELADIIYHLGEERRARAVARAILEARRRGPIETTRQLADLVACHVRAEPGGNHPATRTFQALRIAVNDELGELARALHAAERVLKPGGRLAVVTFHSLEDRIVKQFLAARAGRESAGSRHLPGKALSAPTFALVRRGPIAPGEAEVARNPRARSAKLRVAERTAAETQEAHAGTVALATLPRTADGRKSGR